MRACARVALVLMAVSASFGLAGCGSIDDLKDAISRWFDAAKFPGGRGVFPDDLPDATPVISPEKMPKEEPGKASKKKDKPARKLQRPQSVELPKKRPISDSTEGARAPVRGTEVQPAPPSEPAPLRLRTLWPEAPAPGKFSR
jgi:hypothetical protein